MDHSNQKIQPGSSLPDRIGNTPLIRFERLTGDLPQSIGDRPGITLLAKAEWANPGGSVPGPALRANARPANR